MCKGYVAVSYPMYGRTQVRVHKHTSLGYVTHPAHRDVIPQRYKLVRPNPGSAVQVICRCVISLARGNPMY